MLSNVLYCVYSQGGEDVAGKPKHGGWGTKLYQVWNSMRMRCNNTNDLAYHNYGARGIKVCEEWNTFEPFKEWAFENGYAENLQLDRINNDGNYEPSNCRFVTQRENLAVGRRRKSTKNTSGFTGVTYVESRNKWKSQIKVDYKTYNLGDFETKEEALKCRVLAEIKFFGKQLTNLEVEK